MEEGVGKATQMDGGQLISLSSDPQDLLKEALLILRTPAAKRRRHGSSPEPSSCSVNFSPCCVDLNISVAQDHQDPVSDDPNRRTKEARYEECVHIRGFSNLIGSEVGSTGHPKDIIEKSPLYDETGLKKGPWTPEEDVKLIHYIEKLGVRSWMALPKLAGLNRCGKSCRFRWNNYLRPDIKRGTFSLEEEDTIINLHSIHGNRWSIIARHLPGRTNNEIKNFWNTHLKKKLMQICIDPVTHRPRIDTFSGLPQLKALAILKELVDQQSPENQAARSQNEAAQVADDLQYLQHLLQPLSAFSSNTLS